MLEASLIFGDIRMDLFTFITWTIVVVTLILLLSRCDSDIWLAVWSRVGKSPEKKFAGKVVWITGCSSGIGEQIAYRLAQCGAKLILSARRVEELEKVKRTCCDSFGLLPNDVKVIPIDLIDFYSHEKIVEAAISAFGKIDVLINNAGRSQRANWIDTTSAVDLECFKLNAAAPVSISRLVVRHMIANGGGSVGVISSLAGCFGVERSNSYVAAKHALNGFFRCLAIEHNGDNISVSIICPGLVFSPNNPVSAFTAQPDKPYGESYRRSWFHLAPERCAKLAVSAVANGIGECWVAHPIGVLLAYLRFYCPTLSDLLIKVMGRRLLQRMREGKL